MDKQPKKQEMITVPLDKVAELTFFLFSVQHGIISALHAIDNNMSASAYAELGRLIEHISRTAHDISELDPRIQDEAIKLSEEFHKESVNSAEDIERQRKKILDALKPKDKTPMFQ